MALRRLLAGLGFGGASVETVLDDAVAVPGGVIRGRVHIEGGTVDQHVQELTVGLQTRVEVEAGDSEYTRDMEFTRQQLGGALHLAPGARHTVPFELRIPFEAPLNWYRGTLLHPMRLGVNTRLSIAGAVDPGDLDPVRIAPLPSQQAILDALAALGFVVKHTDTEQGHLRGTRQRLPFYQEIEFHAPPRYRGLNDLELSFATDERGADVVLELDRKSGLLTERSDTYFSFSFDHATATQQDWTGYLHTRIDAIAGRRGWL
ncbi:sporulation protein [Thermobifida cellulosilytica]|uniref:Sporulation protein n=1 Tax=Thermobifida cellulosilytica TB100 TaxID=665004 RepID=A0A147KJM9_THECS|nr:sporulation protein [Thermobifida cellulosilytica]KUP97496.1 sporulation protein [Thermobifida cellulosilytica TB100]